MFGRRDATPDRTQLIKALKFSQARQQEVIGEIGHIRSRLERMQAGHVWTAALQEPLLAQVQALRVQIISKLTGLEDSYSFCGIENNSAQDWLLEYNNDRHIQALKLETATPGTLPEPVRSYFAASWQFLARHETGRMGSQRGVYVDGGDLVDEVTLLEMPSSELLGWCWNDANWLSVIIKKDALDKSDFSMVTSNFATGEFPGVNSREL